MKKLLQIPLLLVALFLTSIPISAHDFEVDGLYYNILSSTTVEVTHEGGNEISRYAGALTIPSSVTYNSTTYSVTSIGEQAFYNCAGLTSVTIPNSVTEIGREAFHYTGWYNNLPDGVVYINNILYSYKGTMPAGTSIDVKEGTISISGYAFYNCTGLTSVDIPNSVTSIGKQAFYNTGWYNNLPDGVVYINNILYSYKGTMPAGTSIDVKEGTILIGRSAFSGCDGLTSVDIPNSVTSIGASAFHNCTGLTSVTIPNSVTSIGGYAFGYCRGLTSVTIGNSVTSIGYGAFRDCSGLTSVDIPNSVTSIGSSAFRGCSGLTSVDIPNSVTSIGNCTFQNCSGLTSVDIPNSVTSIGTYAFSGCTGLTSVDIPNSVTSIGTYAFYDCTGLTSVTIPNSVTSIGSSAFYGCSGLTSVDIPNSVTEIGSSAFSGCTGLTSVDIPNSVTSIGSSAFYNTPWYNNQPDGVIYLGKVLYKYKGTMPVGTSIDVKEGTISISGYAFYNCTGLTSVTIPNSVTSIGSSAFYGCSGLTSITLKSETPPTIYYNSFTNYNATLYVPFSSLDAYSTAENWRYFTNIKGFSIDGLIYSIISNTEVQVIGVTTFDNSIAIPLSITNNNKTYSVTSIGDSAFEGCTGLTSVSIPNSVTSIGNSAFSGCSGLTSVDIPNSVTSIGSSAFSGCSGLTSVTIPNSVTSIGSGAFYGCNKLIDANVTTTQTTATINITSPTQYNVGLYYNDSNKKQAENGVVKLTGLRPNTSVYYDLALIINGIYCPIKNLRITTRSFDAYLSGSVTASSVTAKGSYTEGDVTILGEGINYGSKVSEYDGKNTITVNNLDPNSSYTIYYAVNTQEGGVYTASETFTTSALELTTQEAKPTSTSSVRLLAATNCDATEGTGFEWRRYDAPDELPSSKVSCPVVDGVLVGSLRGVKDDVYYKYRPYYTSSSGKTYYGEWIAFFTGDANVYFEPEVRTYDDIQVINNSATVKGYALEGTDVITAQGFEYWKTGSTITPSSTENRMIVSASGISMSATLANLEYNTTYKYRAFVTTAKGTTYGDEVEFSTGNDPAGIDYIEIDADEMSVTLRENPATGTAWVKIAGAAGEDVQYTITSMSGAVIANGTLLLDGEWNAIDLNCSAGMYLLTINDGTQVKTLRLIVK